jgi:hypothetical protein
VQFQPVDSALEIQKQLKLGFWAATRVAQKHSLTRLRSLTPHRNLTRDSFKTFFNLENYIKAFFNLKINHKNNGRYLAPTRLTR